MLNWSFLTIIIMLKICLTNMIGKLVEYDEPMELIKREGSLFGKLVKEYWSHYRSAELQ